MTIRTWYILQTATAILGLFIALVNAWIALGLAIALFLGYVLGEWWTARRAHRPSVGAGADSRI